MGRLEGKVTLITGAGGMRGVGRATALRFASEGSDVALTDILHKPEDLPADEVEAQWRGIESVAEEVQALDRECFATECDLCDREQVQEMISETVKRFGRIDILVNNARALMGRDKVPVTELSPEVWDKFLAVNTTAAFWCTQLAAREMINAGRGGRILNIGSDCSKQARPMGAAYAASKFALIGLTQSSALDLAQHGITVNAVCPGAVNTNRISYWEREQAEKQGVPLKEFREREIEGHAEKTPLGRIAEPEEVANMLAFLASEEASFITGQAYSINGGQLFH